MKKIITATILLIAGGGCATKTELKEATTALSKEIDKKVAGVAEENGKDLELLSETFQRKLEQEVRSRQDGDAAVAEEFNESLASVNNAFRGQIQATNREVTKHDTALRNAGMSGFYDGTRNPGKVLTEQEVRELLQAKASAAELAEAKAQAVKAEEAARVAASTAKTAADTAVAAKAAAQTAQSAASSAQTTAQTAQSTASSAQSVASTAVQPQALTKYVQSTARRFLPFPVQPEEPAMRIKDNDNRPLYGEQTNVGPATMYRWWYKNPGWELQAHVYQWDAPNGAPRWKWVEVTRDGDWLTYSGFEGFDTKDRKRVRLRVEAPKAIFPWPDDVDEKRAKLAWERTRVGRMQIEYECERMPVACGNGICRRCYPGR